MKNWIKLCVNISLK